MSQVQVQSLMLKFGTLFLFCKFFGIYPQNWQAFRREHVFQRSRFGSFTVASTMIFIAIFYNFLIFSFEEEDRSLKATQSTLTFVIGLFLTYIGLIMMLTDQWSAIRNQESLGELFERIQAVDERLLKENVLIDNSRIEARINFMLIVTVTCEVVIFVATYLLLVDYTKVESLLWLFSGLPTFFNSLDKIWFAVILHGLRQRFLAINATLEDLVETHDKFKSWLMGGGEVSKEPLAAITGNQYDQNLEYLYRELNGLDTVSMKGSATKNKIVPIAHSLNTFGEGIETPQKQQNKKAMYNMVYESELTNIPKIEEKLSNLCQLHDEICEIGKTLNELWSYQILVLMAYGFLIFTAQLYFLYCATQEQAIPSLFRSAKNAILTTVYLAYISGKCVYLIYLSWKTSTESKRTGICLHKCGVVADDCLLYEIINHLSLKLLNHSVDFSACGFFTLDMETLYGVSGGITSYLIILIQFNLAAQQAKEAIHAFSNFNETANAMAGLDVDNSTSYGNLLNTTLFSSSTMFSSSSTSTTVDY